jgi:hypothetical protein
MTSEQSASGTDQEEGGRWGRTPFLPEELKAQFGTSDGHTASRLDVTCSGCGIDFYPVASCCVKSGPRAADPFCPNCGVDFRLSEDEIERLVRMKATVRTKEAVDQLRDFVEGHAGIELSEGTTIYQQAEADKLNTEANRAGGESDAE